MKKSLIKLLFLLILLMPVEKVCAASEDVFSIPTNSFSSADTDQSYNFKSSYNFKTTYFYQIKDISGTYLAYSLYYDQNSNRLLSGNVVDEDTSYLVNSFNGRLTYDQLLILKNILASGYQYNSDVSPLINSASDYTKKNILATQILIWEVVDGVRSDYSTTNYNAISKNSYDFVKTDAQLKTIYENILLDASKLSGNNKPASFGKQHILNWSDNLNSYVLNGINIGSYSVSSYDKDNISISSKDSSNNITITSSKDIITPSTIEFKYTKGSTLINANKLRWFESGTNNQKLLLAHYQATSHGNLSVKTENGNFRIVKKDLITGSTIKGAKFELYKCSSQSNCSNNPTAIIDMKNTEISSLINIKRSGLYVIRETITPNGYVKNPDTYVNFSIKDSTVSASIDQSEQNVTKQTQDGILNLIISNRPSYFMIKNIDGRDSSKKINGSTFQISKADGTLINFNKISNGAYKYDPSGIITSIGENDLSSFSISSLPEGEYILEQTKVNYPYVISSKEMEKRTRFKIDSKDYLQVYNYVTNQFVKSLDSSITVKNFETKVTIITTGLKNEILDGVTFELYDENKQNKIPLRLENGNYIYDPSQTNTQLQTQNDGKIIITYLPEGTYYLLEESIPSEYNLAIDEGNKWFEIEISVNRNDATAYDIKKEIRNAKGTFCFYKIDEFGNQINSGKFKLQKYNLSTSNYDDVSLILNTNKTYSIDETNKSDVILFTPVENGQVCFENVPKSGKYRIVEHEAPDGFVLPSVSDTQAQITINENGYAIGDAILINKKMAVGEGAEAQAELIINIQTGQNRINYILIILTISIFIIGLIILKKKIDKK